MIQPYLRTFGTFGSLVHDEGTVGTPMWITRAHSGQISHPKKTLKRQDHFCALSLLGCMSKYSSVRWIAILQSQRRSPGGLDLIAISRSYNRNEMESFLVKFFGFPDDLWRMDESPRQREQHISYTYSFLRATFGVAAAEFIGWLTQPPIPRRRTLGGSGLVLFAWITGYLTQKPLARSSSELLGICFSNQIDMAFFHHLTILLLREKMWHSW